MKDYRNENGGIVTLGILDDKFVSFSPLFKHFREIYPEMELSLVEEGLLVYMINFLLESWILLLLLLMTVQKN